MLGAYFVRKWRKKGLSLRVHFVFLVLSLRLKRRLRFVLRIIYSYDHRIDTVSSSNFLLRRLIRLQPMVVIGAILGTTMFYFQGCEMWSVGSVGLSSLFGTTLLNCFLIPSTMSYVVGARCSLLMDLVGRFSSSILLMFCMLLYLERFQLVCFGGLFLCLQWD